MYKFVYRNLKTGDVLGEGVDRETAYHKAVKNLKTDDVMVVGIDRRYDDEYDIFDKLEGVLWEMGEEYIIPTTPKEWTNEINADSIEVYTFTREMIKELCKSKEGLAFLNGFAKRKDIFQ